MVRNTVRRYSFIYSNLNIINEIEKWRLQMHHILWTGTVNKQILMILTYLAACSCPPIPPHIGLGSIPADCVVMCLGPWSGVMAEGMRAEG